MSTVLAWFTKEWRAQWRALMTFSLLGCMALAIVTMTLAETTWKLTELGPQVMSWFLLVAGSGVLVVAAPQIVRGEFETGSDRFLRRLPGALASAWIAKVLFLLCASTMLFAACWLAGSIVLWWHGVEGALRVHDAVAQANVTIDGFPLATAIAFAIAWLAPWAAASAACLPGGRLAPLVVVASATVVGFGVDRVLQMCPGMRQDIDWLPWIAAVGPAGVALFAFVWAAHRRSGPAIPWRRGLAGCGCLLAIPGVALVIAVANYRDPGEVAELWGLGITPDGRYALAYASPEPQGCSSLPLRIDLELGTAQRIGGESTRLESGTTLPWPAPVGGRHRFWRWRENGGQGLYDAATDRRFLAEESPAAATTDQLRADVRTFEAAELDDAGRVWRNDGSWQLERGGNVRTVPWPFGLSRTLHRRAGHGVFGDDQRSVFDFARLTVLHLPQRCEEAIAVGTEWLVAPARGQWSRFDAEHNILEPRSELDGATGCRGPVGDGQVLLLRGRGYGRSEELLVYRPQDRSLVVLPLPPDFVWPVILDQLGADARGRTWIGSAGGAPIAIDLVAVQFDAVPVSTGMPFALLGNDVFTVESNRRIVRTDYTTGARAVLYPQHER